MFQRFASIEAFSRVLSQPPTKHGPIFHSILIAPIRRRATTIAGF